MNLVVWSVPNDQAAIVVFTCSADEREQLDIGRGPCVPRESDRRPLVSPLHQREGDDLRQLEDLHGILGVSGEPWTTVERAAGSSLASFSEAYQTALVRLAEGDLSANLKAVSDRWLRESTWPRAMQLGGVQTRLATTVGPAREAMSREQQLYCWHGPAVPTFALASGPAGTYEEFRRAKRRRS
jgi:hypothetical protein